MELKSRQDDGEPDTLSESWDAVPGVAVVLSVATLVTLVLVLLMCACKKKEKDDDPALYHVTPLAESTGEKPTSNVAVEVEAVTTEEVGNGSVPTATESNGRPMSHERALPELPPLSSGVPPNEDDEEEDSEGHYDIIPKRSNQQATKSAAPKMVAKAAGGNHAYEKVTGDPDSDSTYAGIGSDCSGVASSAQQPLYAGVDSDDGSCAAGKEDIARSVENVVEVEATYALIDENKRKSKAISTLPASVNPSIGTSEGSYASTPPPVPTKNFEPSDDGLAPPPGLEPPSSSPLLPPRNSMNGGVLGEAMVGGAAVNGTSLPPSGDTGASGPDNGAGGARKKDPPYSHVTARESLDNLRKRHSEEMKAAMLADATYASVDYDEIKSPGAAGVPAGADRASLSSDLYAEIASGEASCRSSTYARVGDVGPMLKVAPTPPSVEALKNLPHHLEEEETPDPGYSAIKSRQQRPQSTGSGMGSIPLSLPSSSSAPTAVASGDDSGRRSPVYAVVDKKRTSKRQTVHVDGDVAQSLSIAPDNQLEISAMYSQVNKGPTRMYLKASQSEQRGQGQGQGKGVKITIREQGANCDPNYQTIDVDGEEAPEDLDPDYDSVRGSAFLGQAAGFDPNDLDDPNYETMPSVRSSTTWQAQAGVATEITGQNNEDVVDGGACGLKLGKREHIYQDIDEAREEAAQHQLL